MDLKTIVYLLTVITIQASKVTSISNRAQAIFNNENKSASQLSDKLHWERGLRESTFQALVREKIHLANLKMRIYSAPIIGYQEHTVPFGDVAILARGQLYNTPTGFKFIQDPYKNDCDGCHNNYLCDRGTCVPYRDQNSKSLMALWTVKRIRHRDEKNGPRYELQFTVSPMSPVATAQFVTRNGNFDYNIPGHVFVIKVKDRHTETRDAYSRDEKFRGKQAQTTFRLPSWLQTNDRLTPPLQEFIPNLFNLNNGEYFTTRNRPRLQDSDPNHTRYLIGISNDYSPQETQVIQERPFVSRQQHFVKTHDKIQKEPDQVKHLHHHFYIPEVADIDIDEKPDKNVASKFVTSDKPVVSSDVHKFILTTNGDNLPLTNIQHTTQRIPKAYAFQNYEKESTVPLPILFHPSNNFQTVPTLTNLPNNIQTIYKLIPITIPNPTQATPFNPSPYFVRFSEPDPTYSNNEPPTVAGYITSISPTETTKFSTHTHPDGSKITIYTPENDIHTTTQSTITSKRLKYPNSINAQLPPPKKGTDTTIPYISSTSITVIPNSERGSQTKVQIIAPPSESTTADYHSTPTDEGTTEFISTTPHITIQEPLKYSKNNHRKYKYETTTPFIESTTLRSLTTSRRYLNRKKPAYVDDLDIFANNLRSTARTTTEKYTETTTDQYTSNEELITTSSENFSSTSTETTTDRNLRINKFLKNFRHRTNSRYNRNYNSKRLRNYARNFTKPESEDQNVETKTSQSLITSISFQVNKNKKNYSDFSRPAILPASTDRPRSYLHKKDSDEYTTDLPETTTFTDQTKAFNDIAQSLVNHARAATYLEQTTTPVFTTTNSH